MNNLLTQLRWRKIRKGYVLEMTVARPDDGHLEWCEVECVDEDGKRCEPPVLNEINTNAVSFLDILTR